MTHLIKRLNSLNTGLFFVFHGLARRWPILDRGVKFFSHEGMALYILLFFGYFWWMLVPSDFFFLLGFVMATLVCALVLSWATALMWPHPRPIVAHPTLKPLIALTQNFKSFPSDHTNISFVFAFITLFHSAQVGMAPIGFLCFATLIALSRIIAGVHYPRDIIGGVIYALVSVYIVSFLYPLTVIF